MVRRAGAIAVWSPKERGLMAREDLGQDPRSNFAKINSMDYGRCVRAVARGRCIAMEVTSALPIRKGP